MEAIGRTRWALAEGYIPLASHGPAPQMVSHETLCLLNTSDQMPMSASRCIFRIESLSGPIASRLLRGARDTFA